MSPTNLWMDKARKKILYHDRVENGLCYRCGKPAIAGRISCEKHRENDIARSRRNNPINRDRYLRNGRCVRCAAPLHQEADVGCITCMNCREHLI
jgi:hypothetical protein